MNNKTTSENITENNSSENQSEKTPSPDSIIILKKDRHTTNPIPPNLSYDYIFKVALIGDSGTGKTSILLRFIDDTFSEDTKSTIGVDFKIVTLELEKNIYAKMQIWDTCGSERFKSLTSSFIKTCNAFVLVFDLTRSSSFQNIDHWINIIKENTSPKFMILIGNKSDLIEQRNVSKEMIVKYCEKNLFNYIEISAKNNTNVEKMFKEVPFQLYKDIKKNSEGNLKNIGIGSFTNIQISKENNVGNDVYNNDVKDVKKNNCC